MKRPARPLGRHESAPHVKAVRTRHIVLAAFDGEHTVYRIMWNNTIVNSFDDREEANTLCRQLNQKEGITS